MKLLKLNLLTKDAKMIAGKQIWYTIINDIVHESKTQITAGKQIWYTIVNTIIHEKEKNFGSGAGIHKKTHYSAAEDGDSQLIYLKSVQSK